MINGNLIPKTNRHGETRRFTVRYDSKPATASEAQKRICVTLNASGQVIRLDEVEVYDLMAELTKALKWGHRRRFH
jgi:hypothetical protein